MLSPFGPNKDIGSYLNLQQRIFQRVQSPDMNNHIIEIVRKSYEAAIDAENIVLTRVEKKRLLSQILKLVLENMIKRLDDKSLSV